MALLLFFLLGTAKCAREDKDPGSALVATVPFARLVQDLNCLPVSLFRLFYVLGHSASVSKKKKIQKKLVKITLRAAL